MRMFPDALVSDRLVFIWLSCKLININKANLDAKLVADKNPGLISLLVENWQTKIQCTRALPTYIHTMYKSCKLLTSVTLLHCYLVK